jgi:hypothetical protein
MISRPKEQDLRETSLRFGLGVSGILFVIRNKKYSAVNFVPSSAKMRTPLRGERSVVGRLPELRGHGICREASGLER